MEEKCYKSANEIIGPCGPCSFINLIGLKGSPKLEKDLQKIGRLKPFYPSDFTSFLVWAKKYNLGFVIYAKHLDLEEKTFQMMYKYEKIPKHKQKEMRKQCEERRRKIIDENKDKVNKLIKDPLDQIDKLLTKGYVVAFTIAEDYKKRGFLVGHMRVCYKKDKDTYYIKDSGRGLLELTKKDMKFDLDNQGKIGAKFEIVGYKKH